MEMRANDKELEVSSLSFVIAYARNRGKVEVRKKKGHSDVCKCR